MPAENIPHIDTCTRYTYIQTNTLRRDNTFSFLSHVHSLRILNWLDFSSESQSTTLTHTLRQAWAKAVVGIRSLANRRSSANVAMALFIYLISELRFTYFAFVHRDSSPPFHSHYAKRCFPCCVVFHSAAAEHGRRFQRTITVMRIRMLLCACACALAMPQTRMRCNKKRKRRCAIFLTKEMFIFQYSQQMERNTILIGIFLLIIGRH